jgi:hypothetical protein
MPVKISFISVGLQPQLKANLSAWPTDYGTARYVQVDLHEMDYATGWAEFVRKAVHGPGPDASEIGLTIS